MCMSNLEILISSIANTGSVPQEQRNNQHEWRYNVAGTGMFGLVAESNPASDQAGKVLRRTACILLATVIPTLYSVHTKT